MKKVRVLIALMVICSLGLLTGCARVTVQDQTGMGMTGQIPPGDAPSAEPEQEQTRESLLWENCYGYAYGSLSEAEQLWYRDMADALGVMAADIKLSVEGLDHGLDETCVDRIFQSVLVDHPELFFVEGYSYTKYTVGDRIVSIEFAGNYSIDWEEACEREQKIAEEAEKILAAVPESPDDYGRIKYIYDTLVTGTDYDRTAPDNQNIYSVFVGHASVCQGYAKAFQYLMERMGIACTLVQGEVLETGEGHAWNLVKADGEFYYVDVTWGDITFHNAEETSEEASEIPELPEWISYDYLCITTDQLLRTHIPDSSMKCPLCTAVEDNYYVREKAFFREYDKEQLEDLVDRRIAEGERTEEGNVILALCCSDAACYEECCSKLLDTQELFGYLEGTGIDTFVYSTDDKQYTLTFFMVTTTP